MQCTQCHCQCDAFCLPVGDYVCMHVCVCVCVCVLRGESRGKEGNIESSVLTTTDFNTTRGSLHRLSASHRYLDSGHKEGMIL